MSIKLEPVIRAGDVVCAAVSETRLRPMGRGQFAAVIAEKHILAVLLRHKEAVLVFAPDGTAMDAKQVEAICPGAVAHLG